MAQRHIPELRTPQIQKFVRNNFVLFVCTHACLNFRVFDLCLWDFYDLDVMFGNVWFVGEVAFCANSLSSCVFFVWAVCNVFTINHGKCCLLRNYDINVSFVILKLII